MDSVSGDIMMSTAEGGYKSGSVYISSGSSVSIDSFLNYEITKLNLLSLVLYNRLNYVKSNHLFGRLIAFSQIFL